MILTLKCITDLYSKPNKDGVQKLIKRNIEYKKQFETSQILVEEYITTKGEASKRWCTIKQGDQYFTIKDKFENIQRLIEPITVRGFR